MAKFYGNVGYAETKDDSKGVWTSKVIEKPYYGDVVKNTRRLQTADKVNDDLYISTDISIVADPYAYNNYHSIRYVIFMGNKWKVMSVDPQFPRLILTLGGVCNE